MSRLFLLKLEFTLILSIVIPTVIDINTVLYAQNLVTNHQIQRVSELIQELENYHEYIPEGSLDLSKAFIDNVNNDSSNKLTKEFIDEMAKVHIDYLDMLTIEAKNKIKLENTSNHIVEEQKKYDKITKFNSEISKELKNYK